MYCGYCGAKNPDEYRFCGMCGQRLLGGEAEATATRRPPQREAPPANVTVMPREPQRPVPLSEVLAEKSAAEQRRQEREAERYIGEAPPPAPPRKEVAPAHLGGPSFLGLSDPAPAGESTPDYLLDDEEDYRPRRSYGRFFMLLLILAIFAGLGYVQWRKSEGLPLSPLAQQPEPAQGESAESGVTLPPPTEAPSTPADAAEAQRAQTPPGVNPEAGGPEPAPPAGVSAQTPAAPGDDDGARADEDPESEGQPEEPENEPPREPEQASLQKPAAAQREAAGESDIDSAAGDRELELGRAYLSGQYGGRDAGEAAKWLWKAVAKGNTDATLALADLYLSGEGVERNCEQARVLLTAAARKGNADAASKLRTVECD